MKNVFGNVLEAFVFFDMDGSDVVRAQQFRTQSSRLLPDVHPDVILAEVESYRYVVSCGGGRRSCRRSRRSRNSSSRRRMSRRCRGLSHGLTRW